MSHTTQPRAFTWSVWTWEGVVHQREVCDFLHEMAEQFGMPFVAYPSHGTDATFREME